MSPFAGAIGADARRRTCMNVSRECAAVLTAFLDRPGFDDCTNRHGALVPVAVTTRSSVARRLDCSRPTTGGEPGSLTCMPGRDAARTSARGRPPELASVLGKSLPPLSLLGHLTGLGSGKGMHRGG
jgi:hypothetical protein